MVSLQDQHPSCTSEQPSTAEFELHDSTIEQLSMMEDQPIDLAEWLSSQAGKEWPTRVLKLFYFSLAKFQLINKWCKWPDVVLSPDSQFFERASQLLEEESEFDSYLIQKAEEFDTKPGAEQRVRLECLIKHLGGVQACDPFCEEADQSLGSYACLVVRDYLRWVGVHDAVKPAEQYQILKTKTKLYTEFVSQL